MLRIPWYLPPRKVEKVSTTVLPISKHEFACWLERKMEEGTESVGDPRNPERCPLHNFESEEHGVNLHFYLSGARVITRPDDVLRDPTPIPAWCEHFQNYAVSEMDIYGGISPQQAIYCLNKS